MMHVISKSSGVFYTPHSGKSPLLHFANDIFAANQNSHFGVCIVGKRLVGKGDALVLAGEIWIVRIMSQSLEILIVEDYEPDAQLLRLLFRRNHVMNHLHLATDGAAALSHIIERVGDGTGNPALVVIMDIRLPKMDGWDVLRRLRADSRTKDLPVIVLSGTMFEEECQKAEKLGANACVRKPVQMEDLAAAFKKCGVSWAISKPGEN